MNRPLFGVVSLVLMPLLVSSCGPSAEERRQAEIAERQRVAAEEALAEQQRVADEAAAVQKRKAQEEQRKAQEEKDRARSAEVSVAYRAWLKMMMNDPSVKPRRYVQALEDVSVQGNTIVLGISITDKDEAIKLCNFTVAGWWDREKYGVPEAKVVFTGNGTTLAKSVHLNTGGHVCK